MTETDRVNARFFPVGCCVIIGVGERGVVLGHERGSVRVWSFGQAWNSKWPHTRAARLSDPVLGEPYIARTAGYVVLNEPSGLERTRCRDVELRHGVHELHRQARETGDPSYAVAADAMLEGQVSRPPRRKHR